MTVHPAVAVCDSIVDARSHLFRAAIETPSPIPSIPPMVAHVGNRRFMLTLNL